MLHRRCRSRFCTTPNRLSYRELVEGAHPRLEFYPLAGDPKGMMELTVKHKWVGGGGGGVLPVAL